MAVDRRIEVAVTAPELSVLPCAAAHSPFLADAAVVDCVLVTVVFPLSVTVTGVVVAADPPALGVVPAFGAPP